MDQELVTRFTADISQYKKSMASLQAELKQLSGVTDKIKTVTAKAMSSASSDTRKMGKQVDTLIKSQERNVQCCENIRVYGKSQTAERSAAQSGRNIQAVVQPLKRGNSHLPGTAGVFEVL